MPELPGPSPDCARNYPILTVRVRLTRRERQTIFDVTHSEMSLSVVIVGFLLAHDHASERIETSCTVSAGKGNLTKVRLGVP